MPQGKVKWFNNAKGYGFIIADENCGDLCREDLFVHFSSIQMDGYKTLKAGQPVQFDTLPSGKGVHAVNIVPLDVDGSPLVERREELSQPIEGSVAEKQIRRPETVSA